jgi:branched-chain amino acid transport system ATP-binding protein
VKGEQTKCSLTVRAGTIAGLIGPNGSGKNSVLNIITGFYNAGTGVLLDEPAAGSNPVLAERMMVFITSRNREGATILIIEHDMGLIMACCDPVIVVDAGRPLVEGSPALVQNDRRVLDAYLGD